MAYTKTIWNDNAAPAINAKNLNKIEVGIYDVANRGDYLQTALNALADKVLTEGSAVSPYQTVIGWRINEADGTSMADSAYKLIKFTLPSSTKWFRVTSDGGNVLSQFQNSYDVPENKSNRVGQTFTGNGAFYNESNCRVFIVSCGINSNTTVKALS